MALNNLQWLMCHKTKSTHIYLSVCGGCSSSMLTTISRGLIHTHTHTHTHIYIYLCVCMCARKRRMWENLDINNVWENSAISPKNWMLNGILSFKLICTTPRLFLLFYLCIEYISIIFIVGVRHSQPPLEIPSRGKKQRDLFTDVINLERNLRAAHE